jgi:hypothetical protein
VTQRQRLSAHLRHRSGRHFRLAKPAGCLRDVAVALRLAAGSGALPCLAAREDQQRRRIARRGFDAQLHVLQEGLSLARHLRTV